MRDDAMRKEDVLQLMIDSDCHVTAADLAKHYAKYEYEILIGNYVNHLSLIHKVSKINWIHAYVY